MCEGDSAGRDARVWGANFRGRLHGVATCEMRRGIYLHDFAKWLMPSGEFEWGVGYFQSIVGLVIPMIMLICLHEIFHYKHY